jgi:hypothetical protein
MKNAATAEIFLCQGLSIYLTYTKDFYNSQSFSRLQLAVIHFRVLANGDRRPRL